MDIYAVKDVHTVAGLLKLYFRSMEPSLFHITDSAAVKEFNDALGKTKNWFQFSYLNSYRK